jgi:hypothetical protein
MGEAIMKWKLLVIRSVGAIAVAHAVGGEPSDGKPSAAPTWRTAVYSEWDKGAGVCSLKLSNAVMHLAGDKARQFRLQSLWRYDPQKKSWSKTNLRADEPVVLKPTTDTVYSSKTDPVIKKMALEIGLYWANWIEDGHRVGDLVFCGSPCQDVRFGPPPKGQIAACVPLSATHSGARFVPDPETYCREPDAAKPNK